MALGLEFAVSQLKFRVSPTLAVLGPEIVTFSGATVKDKIRFHCKMHHYLKKAYTYID